MGCLACNTKLEADHQIIKTKLDHSKAMKSVISFFFSISLIVYFVAISSAPPVWKQPKICHGNCKQRSFILELPEELRKQVPPKAS